MIPFIFTVICRALKLGFKKRKDVSFMYRWFIYDTMEYWIVPRQSHFILVNDTIWSVPTAAVWWPSLGKFVHGLSNILFMTHHTYRYIITIVCACRVLAQREGLSFAHCLWNTWHHWFIVFSIATTECTVAASNFLWVSNILSNSILQANKFILLTINFIISTFRPPIQVVFLRAMFIT